MSDPERATPSTTVRRKRSVKSMTPGKKDRVKENALGELIYKGHSSYTIMSNIQMGIRVSVGKVTPLPLKDPLAPEDFDSKTRIAFPKEGSLETPAHNFDSFKFKEYAPMVFRHLRENWQIDAGDFMVSICGDNHLRELRTPGKSGALFYFTEDMNYIIKTATKEEGKLLRRILPSYYGHVKQNPETLLTKFFAMVRVKPHHGRNIRLLVMNNIFPPGKDIVTKYDLKGSSVGRRASDAERLKKGCIMKDLDLAEPLKLGTERKAKLLGQLARDVKFLAKQNIMDYSLLLGIDADGEYHMGIIDILQEYNLVKKIEHGWKSLSYQKDTMSAVHPKTYARRFLDFMEKHIA